MYCFVVLFCLFIDSSRPPSSSIPSVDSSKPISTVNMTIPNQMDLNFNTTHTIARQNISNDNENNNNNNNNEKNKNENNNNDNSCQLPNTSTTIGTVVSSSSSSANNNKNANTTDIKENINFLSNMSKDTRTNTNETDVNMTQSQSQSQLLSQNSNENGQTLQQTSKNSESQVSHRPTSLVRGHSAPQGTVNNNNINSNFMTQSINGISNTVNNTVQTAQSVQSGPSYKQHAPAPLSMPPSIYNVQTPNTNNSKLHSAYQIVCYLFSFCLLSFSCFSLFISNILF